MLRTLADRKRHRHSSRRTCQRELMNGRRRPRRGTGIRFPTRCVGWPPGGPERTGNRGYATHGHRGHHVPEHPKGSPRQLSGFGARAKRSCGIRLKNAVSAGRSIARLDRLLRRQERDARRATQARGDDHAPGSFIETSGGAPSSVYTERSFAGKTLARSARRFYTARGAVD